MKRDYRLMLTVVNFQIVCLHDGGAESRNTPLAGLQIAR